MPECSIGLVPDVGGSFLLTQRSKYLGIFLGTTGTHMNALDSIFVGFADYMIDEKHWDVVKKEIIKTSSLMSIEKFMKPPKKSRLEDWLPMINEVFSEPSISEVLKKIVGHSELKDSAHRLILASPLSVVVTFLMLQMPEVSRSVCSALEVEYRYTARAQEFTDFQEGIRAMIVDKDKQPAWKHANLDIVKESEALSLLQPLPKGLGLKF